MISRIDHVSIAVHDYDKAVDFFQKLGAVPGTSGKNNTIHYFWHVLSVGDLSRIELIMPADKGSFLDGFLSERKDGGVHHITFETHDIKAAKDHLDAVGIPYFGFQDTREKWKELFIHPNDAFGVLIQIAEFKPDYYLANSEKFTTDKKWVVINHNNKTGLTIAHPGGGKFHIDLTREETEKLIADLKRAL